MSDAPIRPEDLSRLRTALSEEPPVVLDANQQAVVDELLAGNTGHIQNLIRSMKSGIGRELLSEEPYLEARAVVANVRYNVRRLIHVEPLLSARVAAGELAVIGAVYDLTTGRVVRV